MFWNNLYFELLAFQRDRWVLLVIVLFFGFTFFALRNGQQAVIERQNAINKEVQHMDSLDAARVAKIIAYENDPTIVQAEYDPRDPRDLWGMSYTTPRVVSMPPQPLSLVAIGQSDLFPHVVKP